MDAIKKIDIYELFGVDSAASIQEVGAIAIMIFV